MVRKIAALILSALLIAVPAAAREALSTNPVEPAPPIELNCESAILIEPESGQVIFEKDADARRPVASVTKIMAILLCCEAVEQGRISLDDTIAISRQAEQMGGSQVLLDVGETQTVRVLLKSMIVGSANDATVAMGEFLFGSEQLMVERMNARAAELGMNDTRFVNSTGLPAEGHYTTARDVARMSMELIKHPVYFEFSTIWMDEVDHGDGRVTQLTNTNRLIRLYEGCDGIKTGSTQEAGYCISASAVRGDMRLIAVALGAKTGKERFSIAGDMLDYGFATYRRLRVAQQGARVRGEMRVTGGQTDAVPLYLDGDLTLLVKKGEEDQIELTPNLPESIHAPVEAGQQVGEVEIKRDGRTVGRIAVAAQNSVGRQTLFTGLGRVLARWFYQ